MQVDQQPARRRPSDLPVRTVDRRMQPPPRCRKLRGTACRFAQVAVRVELATVEPVDHEMGPRAGACKERGDHETRQILRVRIIHGDTGRTGAIRQCIGREQPAVWRDDHERRVTRRVLQPAARVGDGLTDGICRRWHRRGCADVATACAHGRAEDECTERAPQKMFHEIMVSPQ